MSNRIVDVKKSNPNANIYSFWQSPSYIESPPPYILLGFASSKFALGDNFKILNVNTAAEIIGYEFERKDWKFVDEKDQERRELMSIVAKSDFIRLSLVNKAGGIWIDADTVILRRIEDLFDDLDLQEGELAWHSEQLFGALLGNQILHEASSKMLDDEYQVWGNPGGLKDLIKRHRNSVKEIPYSLINSGYSPEYNYSTRDIMLDTGIAASSFLLNPNQSILKLYNTPFSRTDFGKMTIEEFLNQDILLTKIFLHINPNKKEWIEMAKTIYFDTLDLGRR